MVLGRIQNSPRRKEHERNNRVIPNWLAVLQLQRLLLVQASEQLRIGDANSALEILQASRRLAHATGEFPGLIAEQIAQAALLSQQPILRSLCLPYGGWEEELLNWDAKNEILIDLEFEAFTAYHASRQEFPFGGDDPGVFGATRPALRNYARRLHQGLRFLPDADLLTATPEELDAQLLAQIPRWNIIGRMFFFNFSNSWFKAARLDLSAELTALVFEERRRRADDTAPAPTALPKSKAWIGSTKRLRRV